MLRRDYIQAEIQKLAQVLARIIGLKREGSDQVASTLLQNTLHEQFGINLFEISEAEAEAFAESIKLKGFPPEKVDLLARFLFESVHPLRSSNEITVPTLQKVLALYRLLEKEYHQQSLENLQRLSLIEKFLRENHE